MTMAELKLLPCPFCGAKIRIVVCDDDYENDPWSGLGYQLYHDIDDAPDMECPIAGNRGEGIMGIWNYYSREEAAEAWNRRC